MQSYSHCVVLRLSDVVADPVLSVSLVDGAPAALSRPVRWVAVTELADPRPFLSGGELVLTTGLRQRTAATQREFVERLAERDAVGLGFGIGLTHNTVPAATLDEARARGLPVLEIPYSTPFIAVDRFVADRILEEQYGRFHDLLNEYDTLARSLLSGRGLGALVDSLHQILGAPVMLLAGQRQLAGQVLENLVRGALTTAEAERRLATFGIKAAAQHAILVGTVQQSGGELRRHLAASPPLPGAATAVLEDCLVAVLGPGQPLHEAAHLMHAHLSQHGSGARVGIGGWYTGVTGLRWSYYEAHEAMTRGPGINERERMSLSGLLLASEDVPLRDLAEDLLRPLREFDAAHAGSLIPTLRAYLDANGSVAEVAEQLIVHRNTVRYRLEQIERLTGQSLSSTATRVQLWLALSAVQLGHPSPGPP